MRWVLLIESRNKLSIKKEFNLSSTTVVENILLKAAVDLYPEYIRTAYLVVLHHTKLLSAQKIFQILKKEYEQHYQLIWLSPFGFNNSQSLAVIENFSKKHRL
ncbi:glycine betaine ABC transporter substrate-binding protein [Coxiella-like endosymbiont]|uniref:glycine betaine ABC transporter substrate-binding protein n=1 Tax=Coxiella-like endosymbiont TaxID=1592897 RepID=UPI00272CFE5D|nr:glycine betaine ABC transporter substrate-binding protein [Coxiella-like endosymbiont]